MKRLFHLAAAVLALALGACTTATRSSSGSYSVVAYAPNNPDNVRVKVSLATQNIYVLEGDRLLMAVQGCVGANGATPKGQFRIINKDRRKRRVSNPDAGYPMAYWCEFQPAYGFHEGFVWGIPRTHGCIRLHREAAARMYALVKIGTPVNIAASQPEDSKYGSQVRHLDQRNDPDPPRPLMMSPGWFTDPKGPLLVHQ